MTIIVYSMNIIAIFLLAVVPVSDGFTPVESSSLSALERRSELRQKARSFLLLQAKWEWVKALRCRKRLTR